MSTELATTNGAAIDPSTLEAVIVNGDLSKLSTIQKMAWYKARCEAAGLDPRTQPFQYLSLQGKLTLYATKSATDQLISSRKLNVEIVDRRHDKDLGVYEVRCRVAFPDGRSVEDFAALSIATLKGDALCNAMMKCVTKAKRRTVLSACGLGMLDESEIETIPGAAIVSPDAHHARNHDNATGHGSGAYADPETVKAFQAWARDQCEEVNAKWLDHLTTPGGEIRKGPGEIINPFRLAAHLVKWGRVSGILNAPEDTRAGSRDKYAAVVWSKRPEATHAEAMAYCRDQWRECNAKLDSPMVDPPEDEGDDIPDDLTSADVWPEGKE